MVWSEFRYHDVGKLEFEKNITVNKERYYELLCDNLVNCFEACQSEIFKHQFAQVKIDQAMARILLGTNIKDWPGNKPELEPQRTFATMKRHLGQEASSVHKLEICRSLEPSLPQNLAQPVPNRFKDCCKMKEQPKVLKYIKIQK